MLLTQETQRQTLVAKYQSVRALTFKLCAPLKAEDHVVQPVVDVSPPKWHMGHTTWFFEEFVLQSFSPHYERFHPRYAYIFNSYYEGAGERVNRSHRGNLSRPAVEEVRAYRKYVDQQMLSLLSGELPLSERALQIIELGLQHEQQHQELLLYDIKYILGNNPLYPEYAVDLRNALPTQERIRPLQYLDIDAGIYEIGHQGQDFHFDNEEGAHKVYLEPFRVMNRLVTNEEYIEFIEAGAYKQFQYWFQEAWHWVNQQQLEAPFYWYKVDGEWYHYTFDGLQPVDPKLPAVHISNYEADAYAKWKGQRLLTEFEWEAACKLLSPEIPENANFVGQGYWHPVPAQGDNLQFYGDAWEWTQSAYLPYPYFKAEAGPLGEYNGKFMINQMVLRGGSCATARDHIRVSYRNFFHPQLRWLFAGIRLAESR